MITFDGIHGCAEHLIGQFIGEHRKAAHNTPLQYSTSIYVVEYIFDSICGCFGTKNIRPKI